MREQSRTVALRVLGDRAGRAPMMGQSRNGRRRAVVLGLIHILMIAHLIQWFVAGMTLSPLEPSESMETLELGVVNAGAILFGLALLSTALLGRFFCGWACHMVALQDLCAVAMARLGVRPKPFRSRVLVFFPLVLGFSMFIWPTLKRVAIHPLLEASDIRWPAWIRPPGEIHAWRSELLVEDFWATFPEWYVAVPFLFICGFGAVYFLGAKGFCTYGCPYGGLFAPLDKIAPVRIKVNDSCEQCGYCTSVCTSNVRVSEEVRDYGVVIDPGCMKTLDCVAACPNDALRVGIGGPSLGRKARNPETAHAARAKARRRYDLTIAGELGAAALFLWLFYATRGVLDQVPMLLAGGLAAIGTFLFVHGVWLVTRRDVRIHGFILKSRGRVRAWGGVLALGVLALGAGSAWSANAKFGRWRGDLSFRESEIPVTVLLRGEFLASPGLEDEAERAISAYESVDSFRYGGIGWSLNAEHRVRLAYFYTLVRRYEDAVDQLDLAIRDGNPTAQLVIRRGQIAMMVDPSSETLVRNNESALAAHPDLHLIRAELAKGYASRGDPERAEGMWDEEPGEDRLGWTLAQASYAMFINDRARATRLLEDAWSMVADDEAHGAGDRCVLVARSAYALGLVELVRTATARAASLGDASASALIGSAELAMNIGDTEDALERAGRALAHPAGADSAAVVQTVAILHARAGDGARAGALLRDAIVVAGSDFDRQSVATNMVRVGATLGDEALIGSGLDELRALAADREDLPIFTADLAQVLWSLQRAPEAISVMERAAMLDERNAILAYRLSELYSLSGDTERAQHWIEIGDERQAALEGAAP